jgi:phosphomevalonate kinase
MPSKKEAHQSVQSRMMTESNLHFKKTTKMKMQKSSVGRETSSETVAIRKGVWMVPAFGVVVKEVVRSEAELIGFSDRLNVDCKGERGIGSEVLGLSTH